MRHKLIEFTREWVESIPKKINDNGCWIPLKLKPDRGGYIRISNGYRRFVLHRLVLSIYYNIDYYDKRIETRHSKGCDRRCFFHDHLKPGSHIENKKDQLEHHSGELCPKCGGVYSYRRKLKYFVPRIERRCKRCDRINQQKRRLNEKLKLG